MKKNESPLYHRYFKPYDLSTQGYIFATLPAPYDYVPNDNDENTYHIEIVIPKNLSGTMPKTMEEIDKIKMTKPVRKVPSKPISAPIQPVVNRVPVKAPAQAPSPIVNRSPVKAPGPNALKPVRLFNADIPQEEIG